MKTYILSKAAMTILLRSPFPILVQTSKMEFFLNAVQGGRTGVRDAPILPHADADTDMMFPSSTPKSRKSDEVDECRLYKLGLRRKSCKSIKI